MAVVIAVSVVKEMPSTGLQHRTRKYCIQQYHCLLHVHHHHHHHLLYDRQTQTQRHVNVWIVVKAYACGSVPSLEHSDGTDGHGHVREIDAQNGLAHKGKNGLLLCPQTVELGGGRVAYRGQHQAGFSHDKLSEFNKEYTISHPPTSLE